MNFNTAFYIRLSKEDNDKSENNSISTQKKILYQYINNKEEFSLYKIYVDDGYSGLNFNRPSFQNLLNDVDMKLINCIIVKDLSRLGRNYIETGLYIEKFFPDNNIRFISINDNYDSYNIENNYNILIPIKNIFNEYYSKDISNKIKSAFKSKQNEGLFVGSFSCYGYKKDNNNKHKLIIDKYPAQIVKRIFEMYMNGFGKISIAKILNKEGVLCPSEYKKQQGLKYKNSNRINNTYYWTYSTINSILKNEMYIGNMVQGKTRRKLKGKSELLNKNCWIKIKNTHTPIIDEKTWYIVQNLLSNKSKQLNFNNNVNIFAGLIVCADCGRSMIKTKISNNLFFTCGSYKRYGVKICTSHIIKYNFLLDIVLKDLNVALKSIKNLKLFVDDILNNEIYCKEYYQSEIENLIFSIKKIDKLKSELYFDFKENLINKDDYLYIKNDYERKKNKYQNQYESIKKEYINNINKIKYSNWINNLLSYGFVKELDREIIVAMIKKIYIYNDTIKIIYNFSNDLEVLLS